MNSLSRMFYKYFLVHSCATCKPFPQQYKNKMAWKLHIITHPARFHYVIKESFTRLQLLSLLALAPCAVWPVIIGYNLDKLKIYHSTKRPSICSLAVQFCCMLKGDFNACILLFFYWQINIKYREIIDRGRLHNSPYNNPHVWIYSGREHENLWSPGSSVHRSDFHQSIIQRHLKGEATSHS